MGGMRYKPRRLYDRGRYPDYVESDRDYLANNNDLAVSLLDNYGAIKRGEPLSVRHLKRQFDQAEKAFNDYVEAAMRGIMATDKRLGTLLKCMGAITAYDRGGCPMGEFGEYGNKPPASVMKLIDLCNRYDTAYACRTGHPLRLKRLSDGTIEERRDW